MNNPFSVTVYHFDDRREVTRYRTEPEAISAAEIIADSLTYGSVEVWDSLKHRQVAEFAARHPREARK